MLSDLIIRMATVLAVISTMSFGFSCSLIAMGKGSERITARNEDFGR